MCACVCLFLAFTFEAEGIVETQTRTAIMSAMQQVFVKMTHFPALEQHTLRPTSLLGCVVDLQMRGLFRLCTGLLEARVLGTLICPFV